VLLTLSHYAVVPLPRIIFL